MPTNDDSTGQNFWDKKYKTRKMVSPLEFTEKARSYLEKIDNPHVLDIGCGDGRDSLYFVQHGCTVTAIDYSEEAIERVKAENGDIDAQVVDILKMDFPDASFDAVYAHLAIQYFTDEKTDEVIANIHRMLRPGGLFLVKCKSTEDSLYGQGELVEKDMYRLKYDRHFFSLEYMKEKLQNYEILELESTHSTYDNKTSAFIKAVARV